MMKKRLLFLFMLSIAFASCMEKTGHYDPGQQKVINDLTGKYWERDYHAKLDNGEELDIHEAWMFKDNGNGSCRNVTTYESGHSEETTTYFHWSFTTPNFNVIYMDYDLFWEIKELTPTTLHVYETYKDPVTIPGQTYRDYQEYQSTPVNK